MTGFGAFFGKELREIIRTWRLWVIPGLVLFFALTSPVVALLTPKLLASLASSQPGVVIQLPDPTARDGFGQFVKNLNQILLLAIIITGAGAVSGERSSGTAILTLTKPLSRTAFVLAKIVSQSLLLVVSAVLGTAVTAAMTTILFGAGPMSDFLAAVAVWLVFALLLVVLMVWLSVLVPARGGAAGAGLGFFFVVLLLSAWPKIAETTFVGLQGASARLLMGQPVSLTLPIFTAAIAAALLTVHAVAVFRRQEL